MSWIKKTSFLKIILSFCFCFRFFSAIAGGYWYWEMATPCNNQVIHDTQKNGIELVCKEDRKNSIKHLRRWYFYKSFVIGEFIRKDTLNQGKETLLFLFDEKSCKTQIFNSKSRFDEARKKQKLFPLIWTRWYSDQWGIFLISDVADLVRFVFFMLPFFIMILIWFVILIAKKRFNTKNLGTQLFLLIVFLVFLRYLLDVYPSSI